MRWILTGEDFGAEEALRLGLIQGDHRLAKGAVTEIAETHRHALSAPGPSRARCARHTLRSMRATTLPSPITSPRSTRAVRERKDPEEGVLSFTERGQANFKGK